MAGAQAYAQTSEETMQITQVHQAITSQSGWLNTQRELKPEDLKGRIILLDFWTFCCINCIHIMPDLKYLEEKFGHDLTVIGVHSAKFKNEQDTDNIRSAILRYGLEHPVVNDFDFTIWKRFGVRAWPTLVLINPQGIIEEVYSGEGNRDAIEKDVEALRKKYAGTFVNTALPMALEKDKAPRSVLSFPGKMTTGLLVPSDKPITVLYVSDSGNNRVLVVTPYTSEILYEIGSGKAGNKDGDFKTAQFRNPQGLAIKGHTLYVADTDNHTIRAIDLLTQTVSTIAGTGVQGYERSVKSAPAIRTALASPWDVALYPDDKHLAIAMAGTHQLWSYDIEQKTVSVIAGNGRESIDDGAYPYNSLSQPSGLSVYENKLYFVDSETSSLRVLENGEIRTLIGTGLFDFGFKDGKQGSALMQHAIGVHADETGVYIADSYNHSIRCYDPKTGELSTYSGDGKRGNETGKLAATRYNEPNDVERIMDTLYVADTNNNRILKLEKGAATMLDIMPLEMEAVAFSEDLPNATPLASAQASTQGSSVQLKLDKGWKINHEAPSFMALFEKTGNQWETVKSYTREELEKRQVTLPALTADKEYRLQGTFYYCEDKAGALCLIRSVDSPVDVKEAGSKTIEIPLQQ